MDALTEELNLPVKGGRSTTFRRRQKQRGLEPDNCWWIVSEPLVRGKTEMDLRRDPPPDLALERDVAHRSLDRMGIYAALQVPEVRRWDGQTLVSYLPGSGGRYAMSTISRAVPGLTVALLARFLSLQGTVDVNAVVRQFRAWVRQDFPTSGVSGPGSPWVPVHRAPARILRAARCATL